MKTTSTVRMGFLTGFVGVDPYQPYDEYVPNGLVKSGGGNGNSWLIMADTVNPATITVRVLPQAPFDIDDADWEDITEFSFGDRRPEDYGPAFLSGPGDVDDEDLIDLNPFGPSWYRVRVYARGRGAPHPPGVEEFLIVSWPALKAKPRTLKMTSSFAFEAAAEYDQGP